MTTAVLDEPFTLDFDTGVPLRVQRVRPDKVTAVMAFSRLSRIVPDPRGAEDSRYVARSEAHFREYAILRNEIQRMIEGEKAKNVVRFAGYIASGLRGELATGWSLPPICLWSRDELPIQDRRSQVGIESVMQIPHDVIVVAIDGETQYLALRELSKNPSGYGVTERQVNDLQIPVEWYNGISLQAARQIFHDRNTLEVKPTAAVSLSMDSRDPATSLTRELMMNLVLADPDTGEDVSLGNLVSLRARQLKQSDPNWFTLGTLRTLVVNTMLGPAGFQVGARPIDPAQLNLDEVTRVEVREAVATILKRFAAEFKDRERTIIGKPAVVAAIGAITNRTLSRSERHLTRIDLVELLTGIDWTNDPKVWSGIAGKVGTNGKVTVGGSKEVGYAILNALADPDSANGRRIRHRPEGGELG